MKTILPFDEINALRGKLMRHFDAHGHIASQDDCGDIIEELLDLYFLALANAIDSIREQFGTSMELTDEEIEDIIYARIDGATWVDRVWTWFSVGGTIDDILRIAETEAHRIGNTAALEMAVKAGATKKTWHTMLDDRVRDTHEWLESVTVSIGDEFYSFDGDHAQAPGLFERPENNVNCRCELAYG